MILSSRYLIIHQQSFFENAKLLQFPQFPQLPQMNNIQVLFNKEELNPETGIKLFGYVGSKRDCYFSYENNTLLLSTFRTSESEIPISFINHQISQSARRFTLTSSALISHLGQYYKTVGSEVKNNEEPLNTIKRSLQNHQSINLDQTIFQVSKYAITVEYVNKTDTIKFHLMILIKIKSDNVNESLVKKMKDGETLLKKLKKNYKSHIIKLVDTLLS